MLEQEQTSAVRLAGGLRIGERVRSLINDKTLKEGDEGVVIGPCDDLQAADAPMLQHVCAFVQSR